MRRILNFIITGFILWIAAKFFPPYVQIDGFGTLIIATILLWIIEVVLAGLILLLLAAAAALESGLLAVICIIVLLFADIIAFSVLSAKLPGFAVNGFWTKAVLSLCCSVLTISKSKD